MALFLRIITILTLSSTQLSFVYSPTPREWNRYHSPTKRSNVMRTRHKLNGNDEISAPKTGNNQNIPTLLLEHMTLREDKTKYEHNCTESLSGTSCASHAVRFGCDICRFKWFWMTLNKRSLQHIVMRPYSVDISSETNGVAAYGALTARASTIQHKQMPWQRASETTVCAVCAHCAHQVCDGGGNTSTSITNSRNTTFTHQTNSPNEMEFDVVSSVHV